jgi:hypothetical protein
LKNRKGLQKTPLFADNGEEAVSFQWYKRLSPMAGFETLTDRIV